MATPTPGASRHLRAFDYVAIVATVIFIGATIGLYLWGDRLGARLGIFSDYFGHGAQINTGIQALAIAIHLKSYFDTKLHVLEYVSSSATIVVVILLRVFNGSQASEHPWIDTIWWNALIVGGVDLIILSIALGLSKLKLAGTTPAAAHP